MLLSGAYCLDEGTPVMMSYIKMLPFAVLLPNCLLWVSCTAYLTGAHDSKFTDDALNFESNYFIGPYEATLFGKDEEPLMRSHRTKDQRQSFAV